MAAGKIFKAEDGDMDLLADAALGPEPVLEPDDPLRLPDDPANETEARIAHKQHIRDRMRALRLAGMPEVREVLSDRRKRVFLIAMAETGVMANACARAGWTRATAMGLRKADPRFREAWDDAVEFCADAAEAEAFRRGVHGVEKDVYFKGVVVGKETIYSDRMLELTLKARRPDRFRDNHKMEVETKGGVLIVPAAPSEGDWGEQAAAGQAKFREAPEPL